MDIPFHKPIFPHDLNPIIKESTDSGWVTTGPKVKEFEKQLSEYLNAKHVIAVNSCTAALHISLAAKGIGSGDKFIAPTYTFVASVEVGEYLGASPILVDSNPETFNLDLDQVEKKLEEDKNIKGIMFAHVLGNPPDMDRLMSLVEKYDLIFHQYNYQYFLF